MALAFVAAMHAPEEAVYNQAFNVGRTEENYRIREVAELVVAGVPGSRVEFADSAGPDTRNYRVNCDKIKATLPAYKPKWTVEKGIAQLYEAYQRVGIKLDDFEGPRYRRILHIEELMENGLLDENLRWKK
jgi:nucleoside-diphosphate-sugar epimerase